MIHCLNIRESIRGLNKVLPPIRYSRTNTTISLIEELDNMEHTVGSTEEDAMLFYRYLFESGILLQYINNTFRRGDNIINANHTDWYNVINRSFTWRHTPEGSSYWENWNSKWDAYYNENK